MTWYRLYHDYLLAPVIYIHNRFVCPSHRVVIRHPDFGKGYYHDTDHIMLYAMFQMVVDYIEIECAGCVGPKEGLFETDWQKVNRWVRELPILHWFLPPPRNARRGLHRLRWEISLKDEHPSQSESAKDLLTLYRFWVHERPRREDPWEKVSDIRMNGHFYTFRTEQWKKEADQANEIVMAYDKQDQEMLHLIVKNRRCLWT